MVPHVVATILNCGYKEAMMEVSVRDLKTRLSEYLRKLKAGHEITVAEKGRENAVRDRQRDA
jgi:hypothetical protein